MIKTALLTAATLVLLATSSQAGPSWKDVLKEVVIASVQPQPVFVGQPNPYCAPPQVIYYGYPGQQCYRQPRVIVQDCAGRYQVMPRRW